MLLFRNKEFLPSVNAGCGKIMFLHLSVSHSVHGGRGSLYDVTSCLAVWSHVFFWRVSVSGPIFLPRGLCLWSHVLLGVSVQGDLYDKDSSEDPPGQRPPDRDPLDRDPPGQRPLNRPPNRNPWKETPLYRDPLDRDPPVR